MSAPSGARPEPGSDTEPVEQPGRPEVPPLADLDLLRPLPATRRGVRTRAALVAAARTVFERSGYLHARMTDITQEAQCSTGSFYTYFSGKAQIFAAVLYEAQEDMLHPGAGHEAERARPYAALEAANRAYLESYRRNARLMVLMEQVAAIDPRFQELRRRRAEVFIERNARGIADLQERGLADDALDPMLASRALSGMVSRTAHSVLGLGEAGPDGAAPDTVDLEELTREVTRLWANALKMPPDS